MKPTLNNILAVVLGILIGSIFNGGIILTNGMFIPPPVGADLTAR